MAITFNIPKIQWVRVQDSVLDIVPLGNFISLDEKVLKNIKVGFFKNNCTGRFRLRIHTSKDCNTNYAVSNWVNIEDIPHLLFVGNVRFDFNKCVLTKGKRYYVTAEAIDYVRNTDISYMAYTFDYPFKTNDSDDGAPFDCPIRMEFFVK